MITRREIGDEHGDRSLYVVEYKSVYGTWYRFWDDDINSSGSRRTAFHYKELVYRYCKQANPKIWTRKNFRVALYMRAE